MAFDTRPGGREELAIEKRRESGGKPPEPSPMSSAESVAGPAGAKAAAPAFSRGYRGWLLFVLLLGNVMNVADRQGMAAVAPAFKAELHLTDGQLGLVQGLGFAIFYTLFCLPLALLADRINRVRIISACITLFGVMAGLCGLA